MGKILKYNGNKYSNCALIVSKICSFSDFNVSYNESTSYATRFSMNEGGLVTWQFVSSEEQEYVVGVVEKMIGEIIEIEEYKEPQKKTHTKL